MAKWGEGNVLKAAQAVQASPKEAQGWLRYETAQSSRMPLRFAG